VRAALAAADEQASAEAQGAAVAAGDATPGLSAVPLPAGADAMAPAASAQVRHAAARCERSEVGRGGRRLADELVQCASQRNAVVPAHGRMGMLSARTVSLSRARISDGGLGT
jgi:hypothetical protein